MALAMDARSSGAAWSLVTRGNEGALLVGESGHYDAAAQPVDAVDTLGAGDTFIAYALVGLLSGQLPQDTLTRAAKAAADTCLVHGAFGHGAPMEVDLSEMMGLDEIYRTTQPAPAPADA